MAARDESNIRHTVFFVKNIFINFGKNIIKLINKVKDLIIKDRVALGTLTGILGAVPAVLLNLISHALNFSKTYSFTLAGGIFLKGNVTETAGGILLGSVLWIFTAAFISFLIVLLIERTGKDYWWIKGPLLTIVVMHLLIYGFAFNMAQTKIIPVDVATNISMFVENLIFGITTGYLITRWSKLPNT